MNLGPLASPLAGLFGLGVLLRRAAYDRRWLDAAPAPVFTVAVGGLEVGGTGKTPVTELLLGALVSAGKKPALLSRGYGRQTRGLLLRRPGEPMPPGRFGDEPAMIVGGGLDVPVAVSERRPLGMQALAAQGVDCVVMDDAFSHRPQARHLDVVVLCGEAPFGNGHLMPWGSLREPASSLRRASVVWLHFRGAAVLDEPAWWRRYCPKALRVVSEATPSPAASVSGARTELAGRRVLVAAGIARPAEFFAVIEGMGATLVARKALSDHARYDAAVVGELDRLGTASGAELVVVTPKDAVKLRPVWRGAPLVVVGTRPTIRFGGAELARLLGVPGGVVAPAP